jgi:uncharacterized damage-inducible protein DinB
MKRLGWLVLAAALLPVAASAQDSAPVPNPITSLLKQQVTRYSQLQVGAAESMPAEKYDFKPTPEMRSFGSLVLHIAQFNGAVCSRFTSAPAPDIKEMKESDAKDKLVAAAKDSFEYCEKAIGGLDDSTLGQPAGRLGPFNLTRGGALVLLGEEWFDHYGAQAIYLRLNGIQPPSARRTEAPRRMGM